MNKMLHNYGPVKNQILFYFFFLWGLEERKNASVYAAPIDRFKKKI